MQREYCITHEEWSYSQMFDYVPKECIFTSCPPPADADLDWYEYIMSLPVPSEELILMDRNAEVLEADFIG